MNQEISDLIEIDDNDVSIDLLTSYQLSYSKLQQISVTETNNQQRKITELLISKLSSQKIILLNLICCTQDLRIELQKAMISPLKKQLKSISGMNKQQFVHHQNVIDQQQRVFSCNHLNLSLIGLLIDSLIQYASQIDVMGFDKCIMDQQKVYETLENNFEFKMRDFVTYLITLQVMQDLNKRKIDVIQAKHNLLTSINIQRFYSDLMKNSNANIDINNLELQLICCEIQTTIIQLTFKSMYADNNFEMINQQKDVLLNQNLCNILTFFGSLLSIDATNCVDINFRCKDNVIKIQMLILKTEIVIIQKNITSGFMCNHYSLANLRHICSSIITESINAADKNQFHVLINYNTQFNSFQLSCLYYLISCSHLKEFYNIFHKYRIELICKLTIRLLKSNEDDYQNLDLNPEDQINQLTEIMQEINLTSVQFSINLNLRQAIFNIIKIMACKIDGVTTQLGLLSCDLIKDIFITQGYANEIDSSYNVLNSKINEISNKNVNKNENQMLDDLKNQSALEKLDIALMVQIGLHNEIKSTRDDLKEQIVEQIQHCWNLLMQIESTLTQNDDKAMFELVKVKQFLAFKIYSLVILQISSKQSNSDKLFTFFKSMIDYLFKSINDEYNPVLEKLFQELVCFMLEQSSYNSNQLITPVVHQMFDCILMSKDISIRQSDIILKIIKERPEFLTLPSPTNNQLQYNNCFIFCSNQLYKQYNEDIKECRINQVNLLSIIELMIDMKTQDDCIDALQGLDQLVNTLRDYFMSKDGLFEDFIDLITHAIKRYKRLQNNHIVFFDSLDFIFKQPDYCYMSIIAFVSQTYSYADESQMEKINHIAILNNAFILLDSKHIEYFQGSVLQLMIFIWKCNNIESIKNILNIILNQIMKIDDENFTLIESKIYQILIACMVNNFELTFQKITELNLLQRVEKQLFKISSRINHEFDRKILAIGQTQYSQFQLIRMNLTLSFQEDKNNKEMISRGSKLLSKLIKLMSKFKVVGIDNDDDMDLENENLSISFENNPDMLEWNEFLNKIQLPYQELDELKQIKEFVMQLRKHNLFEAVVQSMLQDEIDKLKEIMMWSKLTINGEVVIRKVRKIKRKIKENLM